MQIADSAETQVANDHPPPFAPDSFEAGDSMESDAVSMLKPLGAVNFRFLLLLTTCLALLGTGAKALHDFQVRRMADVFLQQSERAESNGKPAEAAGALDQYLRLMPDDIEARESLCHLLAEMTGSPGGRLRAFRAMEDVLLRDDTRDGVRQLLVDLLMSIRRYRDAADHLDYLLASSGQTAERYFLLGVCRSNLAEYRVAADAWRRAIAADPAMITAYESLADILADRLDQPVEAGECIDAMVNHNVDSHEALLTRSRYRRRNGKLQAALVDAKRAYQVAPGEPDVLILVTELIGVQSAAVGVEAMFHAETVRQHLKEATANYPGDTRLYQAMAQIDLLGSRQDLAEERIRSGLRVAPQKPELMLSLIEVLIARGKIDEARQELTELRKQNVARELLDFLDARLQMTGKRWLQAIATLTEIRENSSTLQGIQDQVDVHLARCYEQIGSHEQRLMALRRALQHNPTSSDVRERLAGALAATGRVEEALSQYRQARQTSEVLLQIARLLTMTNLDSDAEQRDWATVQRVLDEAARSPERLPDVLILRAEIAVAQQRHAAALRLLERGCQRMPGEGRLWLARAELLRRMGEQYEAAAVLEETRQRLGDGVQLVLARAVHALHEAGDAGETLHQLWEEARTANWTFEERNRLLAGFANLHEQTGSLQSARKLRLELSRATPESLRNWMRLLDLALSTGESEQAEDILKHIRAIDGDDGPFSRVSTAALAIMLARNGDRSRLDEATRLLNAAESQLPNAPRVPLGLAQIGELRGDEEAAIEHYLEALARNSRDPSVIRRVVTLLYRRNRLTEAQRIIQKLRDVDAFSLEGDFGRLATEVSLRNQQFDHAVELARKTVTEDADDVPSRLWLAQVLRSTGRHEEAYSEFQRVLKLDSTLPQVWVAFASFLHDSDRTDDGVELLKTAPDHLPDDLVSLTLAQCWLVLNRPQEAGDYFEQALRERPDDVRVLREVAAFHQRQGQPEKAVPLLQQILDTRDGAKASSRPGAGLVSARRALAVIIGARSDWENFSKALELIEANLAAWPHSAADQKVRARLLAGRSSMKYRREAIQLLEAVHQREPLSAADQLLLTQLYISVDNWVQGRDALLALVYGHGDSPEHLARGIRQMLSHGESDGIVEEWLSSLKRQQPRSFRTLELETRYLAATGEYDTAVKRLKAVLEQAPSDQSEPPAARPQPHHVAQVLASIAQGLDRIGRTVAADKIFVEADQLFRLAAERDPQRILDHIAFLAQNWRAAEALPLCETAWSTCPPEQVCAACVQLLHSHQVPPEATGKIMGWLQLALEQHSDSCQVVLQVAHATHLAGQYNRAIDLYRRARVCRPESSLIANELAYLLAVSPAAGPGALEEARKLIGGALERTGPAGPLLDTRGLIRLRQGHHRQAIEDFQQSLDAEPAPATVYHLAEAHLALGDLPAAQAALKKAISQGLHADVVHALERDRFREVRAQLERLPRTATAPGRSTATDVASPLLPRD